MNVTLTVPSTYKGDHVIGSDGVSYPVVAGAVTVPSNVSLPLISAGFVPDGT